MAAESAVRCAVTYCFHISACICVTDGLETESVCVCVHGGLGVFSVSE